MEKKVVYGCVLTNLLGVSLVFNSPVEAEEVIQNDALVELQNEIGSQSFNPRNRAYAGWVVRYFHQYQTRATGNWAQIYMDMFMGKSMCVMVILRMDGRIWEQRIILIGLRLNTSLDKIIEYGKPIIL